VYRTSTASAALALLVLVAEGRAQQGPVSLGVLVGGVVADQTGEDVFVPHDIFGYLGGAFVRYDLSDRFSLEGEVLYVTKGGEENIDNSPEEAADRLDLAYFEFPLLLRFSLSTRGVRPSLFVGPSIAVETSCE